MQWTLEQVARALGLAIPSGLNPVARLAGVSIDSRTIRHGELFIAIRGPRHDGHAFVAQALATGALAAVVQDGAYSDFPAEISGRFFAVEDTLGALQQLARAVLREWRGAPGHRLAAVTGSAGKTTTKEILAAVLGARMRVLKSEGNLNNEYGLPLTLLRLEEADEAIVAELGMSRRGELARLAALCEPDIGIVTCVAPVHLEFFSSVEEIALAKRELIEGLGGRAPVAVLNADDHRVARFGDGFRGKVVTFGIDAAADYRAMDVRSRGIEGSEWDCAGPKGSARVSLPLAGRHNIYNALAAVAAAGEWGVTVAESAAVLRRIRPARMRGELLRFAAGFVVVNDAYNSNPSAMKQVMEAVAATPGYSRRLVAIGEMRELGPTSVELHRECGRDAAGLGKLDWIFAISGDAAEIISGAVAAGFPAERTKFFASSEEAAQFLAGFVEPGDLLLVKGSRGVRMEAIVEAILARHPETAPEISASAEPGAMTPSRQGGS